MSGEHATQPDPAAPGDEPRGRWWLHPFWFAVIPLLTILIARFIWDDRAQSRLDAAIAAVHARGEPLLVSDFRDLNIPPEDDAAVLYMKAIMINGQRPAPTRLTTTQRRPQREFNNRDDVARYLADARAYIEEVPPIFTLARQARACTQADWKIRWRSPLIMVSNDHTYGLREIANNLRVAAFLSLEENNHADAIEYARDILHLARSIQRSNRTIAESYTASGISFRALDILQEASSELQISDDGPTFPTTAFPVPRSTVQSVIHDLLDDEPDRIGWRNAFIGERAIMYDTAQFLTDPNFVAMIGGPPTTRYNPLMWLIAPATKLDTCRYLEYSDRAITVISSPTWPAGQRSLQPPPDRGILSAGRTLAQITPDYALPIQMRFASLAHSRLTAIALAIRLYKLDHGQHPTNLADLVPEYLPTEPIDPFSTTSAPFQYMPEGNWPRIYSVGRDGSDDGGGASYTARTSTGLRLASDRQSRDIVVFLGSAPEPVRQPIPPHTHVPGRGPRAISSLPIPPDETYDPYDP